MLIFVIKLDRDRVIRLVASYQLIEPRVIDSFRAGQGRPAIDPIASLATRHELAPNHWDCGFSFYIMICTRFTAQSMQNQMQLKSCIFLIGNVRLPWQLKKMVPFAETKFVKPIRHRSSRKYLNLFMNGNLLRNTLDLLVESLRN